ncbi:MAG: hypothetical protein QOH68_4027 [Nocardioidaceae bacterium]|jgi:hypothetical protein|nr:hypothetical protein [Nocardioidaceae bacterium]
MSRRPLFGVAVATCLSVLAGCSGGSSDSAASPSPSPTASPTPSPEPIAVKTCPLTGRAPTEAQRIGRVALAVKIDNVSEARPQAGLDHADLVIEETVEGGLTRLFAVFQCDEAPAIGPIRSARTSDGDLLRLLNGAVFAYSGANPRAIAPVRATSRAELLAWDSTPQYFHHEPGRPSPHDIFSSSRQLLAAGLARNHKLHAPRTVFAYGKAAHVGIKASDISMSWPSASATWSWNGHAYVRDQGGSPDILTNGNRVSASNVLAMSIGVRYTGLHDVLGNASPEDVVTGHGAIWVFRDGHVIRGTWHRPDRGHRMVLRDTRGNRLLLTPGRTWIELLPRPGKPTFS